jgi:hypothetical protein
VVLAVTIIRPRMMDAESTSEMSVDFYQITEHSIPEYVFILTTMKSQQHLYYMNCDIMNKILDFLSCACCVPFGVAVDYCLQLLTPYSCVSFSVCSMQLFLLSVVCSCFQHTAAAYGLQLPAAYSYDFLSVPVLSAYC